MSYYFSSSGKPAATAYKELTTNPPPVITVDVETLSKTEREPVGLSIATSPHESFYFPLYPEPDPKLPWFLLQRPDILKVYHNCIFDLNVLGIPAIQFGEIDRENIADTIIMARLAGEVTAALVDLQWKVGRGDIWTANDMLKGNKTMLDYGEEALARKCCIDSEVTFALYEYYLDKTDMEYHNEELKVIPILIDMSNRGIKIDHEVRSRLQVKLTAEVEHLRTLCDGEGFNPASPQQVGYILAKRGNFLPFTRSKKGRGKSLATGEAIIELLDDPIAGIVLQFRHSSKLLNTYIAPIANDERIYTEFNLDAITGRVSSSNRPLQNIPPGEVRNMFLPDSGIFTDSDYSQIELRLLAYLSGDSKMKEIYDNDEDLHQFVADFMQIVRRLSKNVQFAMVYGATAGTIRETAKIRDLKRCHALKDMWFKLFPEAEYYIKSIQRDGLRDGYITTMFGRKIPLPVGYESDEACERKAINYTIQGSAAEIMKRAIVKAQHLPLVLTVHDELLTEGDTREELNGLGLESISECYTPFKSKLLTRWE